MFKRITLFFTIIIISTLVYADSFQNGNLEYSNKNYKKAIEDYKLEIEEKGEDVNTLFNLANSYLKLNNKGEALYTLYKAELLNPREKNIKNLISETEKELNLLNQYRNYNPLSQKENWTLTSIIIIVISLLILSGIIMDRFEFKENLFYKIRRVTLIISIILLLISIIGNINYFIDKNSAIVVSKTEALISPYPGSNVTFSAKEGLKVKISDTYGDFSFITDNNSRYGWVPSEDLGRLWKE